MARAITSSVLVADAHATDAFSGRPMPGGAGGRSSLRPFRVRRRKDSTAMNRAPVIDSITARTRSPLPAHARREMREAVDIRRRGDVLE